MIVSYFVTVTETRRRQVAVVLTLPAGSDPADRHNRLHAEARAEATQPYWDESRTSIQAVWWHEEKRS